MAFAGVAWCAVASRALAQEAAIAAPPSRAQCVASHERAQDERQAGRLLAARALLRECAAAACPSLVSRDCVGWLGELEAELPSVIFRATQDGRDVVSLRVREGDQLLAESLTGTPLELDPGPHRFVAELPGFPRFEATYVLQAGDKSRVVQFVFTSPPVVKAAPPLRVVERPVPNATYWLGGTTLVAALGGSVLGGLALSERADVKERCAPLCSERDLRGVKGLALASDVAFALALVGAGLTVYSYAARPERPAPVALRWSGFALTAEGRF